MELSEEFHRFLAPDADRLVALAGMLAARNVAYRVLSVAGARHLYANLGTSRPGLILVAHYDRARGSPGYLDNSAACLVLVELGARLCAASRPRLPEWPRGEGLALLFTDAEEKPGTEGPLAQGAYALACGLVQALAIGERALPPAESSGPPLFLVLDVVGRGERLMLSTAARDLLARRGRGGEPLALRIEELARRVASAAGKAGMVAPLPLPLPWSDDLGFVLGGLPALTVSLLPEEEAQRYAAFVARRGPFSPAPDRREAGAAWPTTWDYLHTPLDAVGLAEPRALGTMARFLDEMALGGPPPRGTA